MNHQKHQSQIFLNGLKKLQNHTSEVRKILFEMECNKQLKPKKSFYEDGILTLKFEKYDSQLKQKKKYERKNQMSPPKWKSSYANQQFAKNQRVIGKILTGWEMERVKMAQRSYKNPKGTLYFQYFQIFMDLSMIFTLVNFLKIFQKHIRKVLGTNLNKFNFNIKIRLSKEIFNIQNKRDKKVLMPQKAEEQDFNYLKTNFLALPHQLKNLNKKAPLDKEKLSAIFTKLLLGNKLQNIFEKFTYQLFLPLSFLNFILNIQQEQIIILVKIVYQIGFYIIIKQSGMGCFPSHKANLIPMKPCQSVYGYLKVTIQQAHIQKSSTKLFDIDPYLIMRMSNQQYKGYIHKKAGRQHFFNQSFQFIINSCYKSNGRSLQVQLWDQCRLSDKMIGMSTVDIDPIISVNQNNLLTSNILSPNPLSNIQNPQRISQNNNRSQVVLRKNQLKMKIFLNKGSSQAGYVNALFQFIEQPTQTIGFKFEYANLRRKSSIFTTINCWIQVIVGQQILGTHKQKDKQNKDPPSWQQQTLLFKIPKSLKTCTIRVMDDQNQIGKIKLPLNQIISKKGDHHFTQQIHDQQTTSGVLKFIVSVGIKFVKNQMRKQQRNQTQPIKQLISSSPMKKEEVIELQVQKQIIMDQSNAKTAHYTNANQQNMSRVHTLQNSRVVIENQ